MDGWRCLGAGQTGSEQDHGIQPVRPEVYIRINSASSFMHAGTDHVDAAINQSLRRLEVTASRRSKECSAPPRVANSHVGTTLEQDAYRGRISLVGGPMQRRLAGPGPAASQKAADRCSSSSSSSSVQLEP